MNKEHGKHKSYIKVKRVGSTADRLRELPYEKRVCRVEQYPSCADVDASDSGTAIEDYINGIHEAGVEMQVIAAEQNRGTPRFNSKMIPPHPNVDNDPLPRFLERAHEKGIIVLSYISMNYNKPLKIIHPEWLMKFLDFGKPAPENEGWWCFNSPYRDWLPKYLIEYLDNLDLDGFYFDDTNWGSHEGRPFYPACCCNHCEKLFRDETGLTIPTKVDFDSIDFKRFINWRYDKFTDFVSHVFRRVKDRNPDVVLDLHYYARPTTEWVDGHKLNPLKLDEVGSHYFIEAHRTVRESGFIAKVARSMGTPFCVWRNPIQELSECTSDYAPFQEPFSPAIHGLEAMINGGTPIFGSFGGPIELHKDTMKSVFADLKKRVDYIEGETVKYVGLCYSQQNRDFSCSEMSKTLGIEGYTSIGQKHVIGAYEILNRSHLLADIVLDEQLTLNKLSQYRVIFLSNTTCLSDGQCEEIRKFVRDGGTVIATFETSLLDEMGQKRDNFGLADVFGLDYSDSRGGAGDYAVIYVPHDEALSQEFGRIICFGGQEAGIYVRPSEDVQVLCTRSNLKARHVYRKGKRIDQKALDAFDPKIDFDSLEPTVTVHKFGKGQAFYVSGDVGGAYMNNPYPPLKRFVSNLVRRTPPPIDIDAPQCIEATAVMRNPDQLMVHLLNNPTPMIPMDIVEREGVTTHFYLQELNSVRDILIKVNGFRIKSVTLPLQGKSLKVTGHENMFVVPEVKLHEVALVEIEQ